jgi:thioredoxin reductase (NADPH)
MTSPVILKAPYQVAVIGGGPSGLSAAINASADGLTTILVDASPVLGGQAKHSSLIENVLGYPKGVTGETLAKRAEVQALKFGASILKNSAATAIESNGQHVIRLANGESVAAETVILANGLTWRKLTAKRANDFIGKGVVYGAVSRNDYHYRGKVVAVIGGANSAGQAALHISQFAKTVYMLVRHETLSDTMSAYLYQRVLNVRNIIPLFGCEVTEFFGNDRLQAIGISQHGKQDDIVPVTAAVIFIGSEPKTDWVKASGIQTDDHGYIVTNGSYSTNVNGIFAIGDIRNGLAKRVAAAIGDGSSVIASVYQHLKGS